jgi:hypothetical protein
MKTPKDEWGLTGISLLVCGPGKHLPSEPEEIKPECEQRIGDRDWSGYSLWAFVS